MSDDADLLARVRDGALDEFAELVRRHRQQVYSILHRYERDEHRLEDLAQETFIKAWRSLDQFDGRAPFQHWLSKIAVRVALDHLRRQKRYANEVALEQLGDDVLDWLRTDDETNDLDARQASEILEIALRDLSPSDRLVITMLEIEDRSVKEICELMGLTSVAVRVRAVRARARLRKALERLQKEES